MTDCIRADNSYPLANFIDMVGATLCGRPKKIVQDLRDVEDAVPYDIK